MVVESSTTGLLRFRGATHAKGVRMSLGQRLQTLNDRHAALEARISDEGARPRPNETELARLKREKLRLKEEMARLRDGPSGRA
jgi:hypothetical protein